MSSHVGPINAATFSKCGNFFSSGGMDELVMVWKSNICGVAAPEVDWGMGERPKSAPTITSGGGSGMSLPPDVPQRSSYSSSSPRKVPEFSPKKSTLPPSPPKSRPISPPKPPAAAVSSSWAEKARTPSSSVEVPRKSAESFASSSSGPSTRRQPSPPRNSHDNIVPREQLPPSLAKTLDHIIGQVSLLILECTNVLL